MANDESLNNPRVRLCSTIRMHTRRFALNHSYCGRGRCTLLRPIYTRGWVIMGGLFDFFFCSIRTHTFTQLCRTTPLRYTEEGETLSRGCRVLVGSSLFFLRRTTLV